MDLYPHTKSKIKRSSNENIIIEKPLLKVACILDDFSYHCLKYECDLIVLDTDDWPEILLTERPSLLLVESAWTGINRKWSGKVQNINYTKDSILKNITDSCKKLLIPTVFWNKEDPYHFDEFLEASKLFDYIFTTDENCIKKYKEILTHDQVYELPFAAQVKIHNPINREQKELGNVAFAGAYYNIGHLDRNKNMKYLLEPALNYNLHIYDRNYTYNILYSYDHFRFPEIYLPFIKGYVPYEKITDLYKKYSIFLNVNSVNDSPTMFSRRVFELLACGTNVISSYSLGIEKMFPEVVKLSRMKEDTLKYLEILTKNKEERDRLSLLGEREVFNHHTYTLRLETILDKIAVNYKKHVTLGVSIITYTNKENNMDLIFENYERQLYENKELIIILNNDNINLTSWQNKSKSYTNVKIFQIEEIKSLVQCLNYGVENSNLEYIAIFNDDYYGKNYLSDTMNTFKYCNADIVGKYSHYAYSETNQLLSIMLPHIEYRRVKYVKFPTMVIRKEVFDKIKFSEELCRYDVEFLKYCDDNKIFIYAADRFNYVCKTEQNSCIEQVGATHVASGKFIDCFFICEI
ncbi:glycosyltransferase [Clostridium sp. FP2]|uniref:glycosyltransferase family protein n=1 Tax=Clostridium sp. FP2 TaxID=2724481 RepID=UPI0013E8FA6E|nr:glycosyltransferase [Clostridium sp. FP2]MBZ9622592.1 glycosyltransferase [Clostridium sp. FP2]